MGSFIEAQNKTYRDHPPILISDNDQFSDITQLLHKEEDDCSYSSRNNSYKVSLCQREVTVKRLAVCVLLLLIFLTVCLLLYFQTLAAQLELDMAEKPLDSLDMILAEN